jgi:predicted dienelactone hydrolase
MKCVRALPLLVVGCVLAAGAEEQAVGVSQSAEDSVPSGDADTVPFYTVGYTVFHLDVIGNQGEHRPIPVQVWYPSHQRHGRTAVYTSALYGVPLIPGIYDALSWTVTAESAMEDLRIAPPKGKGPDGEDEQRADDREGHDRDNDHGFPVIVFSHGSVDSPIDYYITLERIAARGFVVAAPAHVNNTSDDSRIDYLNTVANRTVLRCFDGLPSPCSRTSILDSMVDRARDIAAVLDALPTWFGRRVDMNRVGMLGHSRGTVSALAAAGGSATWGISPEPRIKAIMGLSVGAAPITFSVNLANVEIPTILVDGTLSLVLSVTEQAFEAVSSPDKQLVVVANAVHRTFSSGLCAQTQSSGAIAEADTPAILDLETVKDALTSPTGTPLDFCTYSDFTSPDDIRSITFDLTGVEVTPTNVPRTGLTSLAEAQQVTDIAVSFFNRVLEVVREDNDPTRH